MSDLLLPAGISRYELDAVNKASDSPGVYAWYAKLDVGPADYRRDVAGDGQTDLGEQKLREVLLRHSVKFEPLPYKASAQSSFGLKWTGSLEPVLQSKIERILRQRDYEDVDEDEKEKAKTRKIQTPFKTQVTRHLLIELLKTASPFLTAPIYIGTTDNLRRRLKEHASEILYYCDFFEKHREKREQILAKIRDGKQPDFAMRVTAMELGPAQLEVYTLDAKKLANHRDISDGDLEALAACVEWLLNRWHRPLAGRM
jgi:hypothetical protein